MKSGLDNGGAAEDSVPAQFGGKSEWLFLVGSYTRAEAHVPKACGEGIVTCALDPATGRVERRSVFRQVLNPSYLALGPAARQVFAVSENSDGAGAVHQFQVGPGGTLTPVACQPTHGAATCHVAVLPGDQVWAASYLGGCVDVYPVRDGRLAPASRVFAYSGHGLNPQRQEASHAHQTVLAPNGRWAYVCDLGADRVWQHDAAAQAEPVGWALPPGHGPRHMVFHPSLPRAYILSELTGAVTLCDWNANSGELRVADPGRPLRQDAAGAAIRLHPSARTLWISIRSSRSLLAFRLDEQGGLSESTEVSLGAGEPRDFAISPDGRWLVSANQCSNDLAVIELDRGTGLPSGGPVGRFELGTPVSVLFLPNE